MRERKFTKLLSLVLVVAMIMSAVVVGVVVASATDYSGYCLFGYIGGVDYGCESDWQSVGDYVFDASGHLTATLPGDASGNAYIAVKTTDCANWYMFTSYCTDTTGTLYKTDAPEAPTEKMLIAGDTEVTFTLVDNGDGTYTLTWTNNTGATCNWGDGQSALIMTMQYAGYASLASTEAEDLKAACEIVSVTVQ